MIKRPVKCYCNDETMPRRLFDVIVNHGEVSIEIKDSQKKIHSADWKDIVHQVNAAKKADKQI